MGICVLSALYPIPTVRKAVSGHSLEFCLPLISPCTELAQGKLLRGSCQLTHWQGGHLAIVNRAYTGLLR